MNGDGIEKKAQFYFMFSNDTKQDANSTKEVIQCWNKPGGIKAASTHHFEPKQDVKLKINTDLFKLYKIKIS